MKVINTTGNSIYIEDIDMHLPYSETREVVDIDTDSIKRSSSLQDLIILGAFEIIEHNNSRIENNLVRLYEKKIHECKVAKEEERMESGKIPEVIIKGHFFEAGGYAKVNRNLAIHLARMGCRVEIAPVTTKRNDLNEIEIAQLSSLREKVGRTAIRIDSVIPSFSDISPKLPYRILYTTIEASTIPKQTISTCNIYDEIWVTSDFSKEVLEKNGVRRNIYVIPSTVDQNLYNEIAESRQFRPSLKKFVFVSVFGWSYRKGYDALLKAYLKEFSGNDDVTLLIVSRYQYSSDSSVFIGDEIDKFIKKYGGSNPAHIARCSKTIPEHEMPSLYRGCHAFALHSRGEGYGLIYTEASLCGLPVIATNYSGHTMFLKDNDNERNSYLVDIDSMQKISSGQMHVHYWDNQMFPLLTSNEFIEKFGGAMRHVYENYEEAKERNKKLQKRIFEGLTCEKSTAIAKKRIDEIWNKIGEQK